MATKGKTHKSTAKRLKLTGTGKVTRSKQRSKNNAHLRNKRGSRRKVVKKNLQLTSNKESRKIKSLLNA